MAKEIKARITFKRDTTYNWAQASKKDSSFIPRVGEPIYYTDDQRCLKIGDGFNAPENLKFIYDFASIADINNLFN